MIGTGMPGRRRICILATVPLTIKAFYGRQIDFLIDHGFDVTVITSSDKDFERSFPKRATLFFVPLGRTISLFGDIFVLVRILRIIGRGKFDIVQYSSPKAAFLGSLAACFCRVRVRLYLMWGLYYVGQSGLKRMLFKTVERIICVCSTHVVPDSRGNANFTVQEKLCPADKVSVVGNGSANGVDLDRFDPGRLQDKRMLIRSSLGISMDAVVIGFVGRIRPDKGIGELVQAFLSLTERYSGLYLFLVGTDESRPADYPSDVYTALTQKEEISLFGWQEYPEDYMAAMDIFALPSYREGFATVNIEASAMQLPVVSTDIPGPRDSVLPNETGFLVPVRQVVPLQQALGKLYKEPDLRRKMGLFGRVWARRFCRELIWKEILSHRLRCLSGEGSFASARQEG